MMPCRICSNYSMVWGNEPGLLNCKFCHKYMCYIRLDKQPIVETEALGFKSKSWE